jgi:hypothetical protein
VTIENSKETNLWPFDAARELFVLWLQDVQDDRHTVFIVLPNDPLISIGSIRFNVATFFGACLRWLMVLQEDSFRVEQWGISK